MSAFLTAWRAIFGTYQPVSFNELTTLADGTATMVTRVADGAAGVNWEYVLMVVVFLLCLYCVFRMLGAVLAAILK